jgi:hypothetical protein
MSLGGLLASAYVWADHNALTLLLAALALPVVGTLAAWLGKGGRTDRYGRLIASVVVGLGLCTLLLAVIALVIAQTGFDRSPLEANVVLLAAPLVCVVTCLGAIRLVFPLNELESVRSAVDIALFAFACAAVLWMFSQFRGWGVVFWGDLGQLALIVLLGVYLVRRLARRAFGRGDR